MSTEPNYPAIIGRLEEQVKVREDKFRQKGSLYNLKQLKQVDRMLKYWQEEYKKRYGADAARIIERPRHEWTTGGAEGAEYCQYCGTHKLTSRILKTVSYHQGGKEFAEPTKCITIKPPENATQME